MNGLERHFHIIPAGHFDYRLVYRGPIPLKGDNLLAWQISVTKWELIFKFHIDYPTLSLHTGNTNTCGFCILHMDYGNCKPECPVYAKSGFDNCQNTPHQTYMMDRDANAALQELNFIRSLEPKS